MACRTHKKKTDESRPQLPRVLTQPEAAIFCPPHGHVWVSNYTREFWGHLEKPGGLKRVRGQYVEDTEEAESAAMRSVLQQLWAQYNYTHGYEKGSCPYDGIF